MTEAVNQIVDLDHLARYTGGDRAINAEVMRLFDAQANDLVARLQGILDARDAKSWMPCSRATRSLAWASNSRITSALMARSPPV